MTRSCALGKTQKKSFLDILLNLLEENPDQMTDKDIREEVDTFLFEGHDTSSVSMTLTLLLLAMHPDVQVSVYIIILKYRIQTSNFFFFLQIHRLNRSKDRARDELFDIFGHSERDATMEDLNSMKYMEAVIKESLRLYPSVPGFTRELLTTLHLSEYIFILHRTTTGFRSMYLLDYQEYLTASYVLKSSAVLTFNLFTAI